MELIVGLLSGAVGGNVAGKLINKIDQGTLINSISGVVGGGLGGAILGIADSTFVGVFLGRLIIACIGAAHPLGYRFVGGVFDQPVCHSNRCLSRCGGQ